MTRGSARQNDALPRHHNCDRAQFPHRRHDTSRLTSPLRSGRATPTPRLPRPVPGERTQSRRPDQRRAPGTCLPSARISTGRRRTQIHRPTLMRSPRPCRQTKSCPLLFVPAASAPPLLSVPPCSRPMHRRPDAKLRRAILTPAQSRRISARAWRSPTCPLLQRPRPGRTHATVALAGHPRPSHAQRLGHGARRSPLPENARETPLAAFFLVPGSCAASPGGGIPRPVPPHHNPPQPRPEQNPPSAHQFSSAVRTGRRISFWRKQ